MSSVEREVEPTPAFPAESADKPPLPVRSRKAAREQAPPAPFEAEQMERATAVAAPRPGVWWATRGVWLAFTAWMVALSGTLLLTQEVLRTQAEVLLITSGVLAVVAWGNQEWVSPFGKVGRFSPALHLARRHLLSLGGLALGALAIWLADVTYLGHPGETFGAAGWLWLLGMGLLVVAAILWPKPGPVIDESPPVEQSPRLAHVETTLPVRPVAYNRQQVVASQPQARGAQTWVAWEVVVLLGILVLSLVLRLWDLANFPYAFNYDEINTGVLAHLYINGPSPSVFSTVWDYINLPALWFTFVAWSLNVLGTSLAALRVPAALFSAVTVLPLYGIVRDAWGRTAAIAGSIVFCFSAAELHYSRTTLNNIVTPFFWAVCFFFVLRGLRTRRPVDWLLAGLAGGLGEYFYYGTRLLPFILIGFALYLLVVHWRQGRRYMGHFAVLVLGYLAGFGPLLAYFSAVRPDLYLGRTGGEGVLKWDHLPTSLDDLQRMWNTLWPLMSENLLGISTNPSRDSVYAGPLLMQAEAALLVLGVALLIWRWRQPAAFLMLMTAGGVLFVGGTLINGTPFIAHWTPAFPAFYAALAVPLGAWAVAGARLPQRFKPIVPVSIALGLCVLGGLNLYYFYHQYKARPPEEVRAAQDRAQAALGTDYRVFDVGPSGQGWDAVSMQYFIHGQEGANLADPAAQIPVPGEPGKGLAFFFYNDNVANRPLVVSAYPGGRSGEIRSQDGTPLFTTYTLTPQQVQAMYGSYLQLFSLNSGQPLWSGQIPSVGVWPPGMSYPVGARLIAGLYIPDAGSYRIQVAGAPATLQVNGRVADQGTDVMLPTGWTPIIIEAYLQAPAELSLLAGVSGSPPRQVPTEHLWPLQRGQAMPGH